MFNIDLSDKVAVITGASQGIGKAIAEVFAEAGASLILLSRNESKLKENQKRLATVVAGFKTATTTKNYIFYVFKP